MIEQIYVDNFKSLKEVTLQLPTLAFFCGPNGSGKSNFAEAWDFLSQTFKNGLSYAVAEKGGFYNMCYRRQRRSRGAISFRFAGKLHASRETVKSVRYEAGFSLQARGEAIRSDFYVSSEWYSFEIETAAVRPSRLRVSREGEKYVLNKDVSDAVVNEYHWLGKPIEDWWEFIKPQAGSLMYSARVGDYFPFDAIAYDMNVRVFRISPRQARGAGTPSVSGELGKYGENLPSALDHMISSDPAGFQQLQSWMKGVVPDLDHFKTDYTETKQLGLFLQEQGVGAPWYAEDLSDGTLMSVALFIAILDQRNRCVFIEEPENSLHPWILRKFLECCREASANRQVLITTQSPIAVATATPENLFLIEKSDGKTAITRAITREPNLAKIIKNDFLDIGEYWMSGGLRAVPGPPALTGDLFKEDDESNEEER